MHARSQPWLSVLSFIVSFTAVSHAQDAPSASTNASSTACAAIFNQTELYFPAKTAYDCLITVPFNASLASQLISYYNTTLQLQSTLAFLKKPPATYQQPAIDLIGGLSNISSQINTSGFANQYEFESAILELVYGAHDGHLAFLGGASAVFSFTSPYQLLSISLDGQQMPKIYVADDFVPYGVSADYTPSAVATINGQNVVDFLDNFAAGNAFGFIGPDGDWNNLVYSAAANIQGLAPINPALASTPFYPGDGFAMTFENGSSVPANTTWLASVSSGLDFSDIVTGQDFYDEFVTLSDFTGYSSTFDFSDQNFTDYAPGTSWADNAYPAADIAQPELGNDGWLTGYYFDDISLAVLSIPNFIGTDEIAQNFSTTVGNFIAGAQQAGMRKVLIDLQQNGGGTQLLASDTFRQFFPSIDPFSGTQFRASGIANDLGNTITPFFNTLSTNDSLYEDLSSSFWVASVYLDASNDETFTSWAAFFGPHAENGDFFSTTARANLSNVVYDMSVTDDGITAYGFADRPATSPQPFAAEDIVILTDGICSSTCALFVEMMNTEAGVRTVVVGGQPKTGTMQAVTGTRGAISYDNESLDDDIFGAQQLNDTLNSTIPSRDYDFNLIYGGFNFRDQVRKNNTALPLQFDYIPADCRILYTPETVNNYANLWAYAASAVWHNSTLCVAGSTPGATGPAITGVNPTAAERAAWSRGSPPAVSPHKRAPPNPFPNNLHRPAAGSAAEAQSGSDGVHTAVQSQPAKRCQTNAQCPVPQICATTTVTTLAGAFLKRYTACDGQCGASNRCPAGTACLALSQQGKDATGAGYLFNANLCRQECDPTKKASGCAAGLACVEKQMCSGGGEVAMCLKPGDASTKCVISTAAPPSATQGVQKPSFGSNTGTDQGGVKTKSEYLADRTVGGSVMAGMAAWS